MMTASNTETATLAALAKTPLAKRALEEADREQQEQRRDVLERLAAAERERAEAIAEASRPIPALREAHKLARQRLREAALELHRAECAQGDAEAAGDARCGVLRRRLADLGNNTIEWTRGALLLEQRIAQSLDEYRSIAEPDNWGGETLRTVHIDRGGRERLRAIGDALVELDRLERDPAASPALIEQRCRAIRESNDTGAPIARGEYSAPGDPRRMPWTARFRAMRERARARREG